jgi:hypothetical protein
VIDTSVLLDAALEQHQIHAATCRPRAQGLVCSACSALLDALMRALQLALGEARS